MLSWRGLSVESVVVERPRLQQIVAPLLKMVYVLDRGLRQRDYVGVVVGCGGDPNWVGCSIYVQVSSCFGSIFV